MVHAVSFIGFFESGELIGLVTNEGDHLCIDGVMHVITRRDGVSKLHRLTQPRIVCAALLYRNHNKVVISPRHFDRLCHVQLHDIKGSGLHYLVEGVPEQGFVDQFGCFHDRKVALRIATEAGQLIGRVKHPPEDQLFSEDLY